MVLGDMDAATKSRALYVANWEGDAILQYELGATNSLTYAGVFAADARLRHPEGMVFWRGHLRVCSSYHSAILTLSRHGIVLEAMTIRLRQSEWCWGLAAEPRTDRLLISTSPPYDFQADLPGDIPSVTESGTLTGV